MAQVPSMADIHEAATTPTSGGILLTSRPGFRSGSVTPQEDPEELPHKRLSIKRVRFNVIEEDSQPTLHKREFAERVQKERNSGEAAVLEPRRRRQKIIEDEDEYSSEEGKVTATPAPRTRRSAPIEQEEEAWNGENVNRQNILDDEERPNKREKKQEKKEKKAPKPESKPSP